MKGSQRWSRQVVMLNINPSEDTSFGSYFMALLLWLIFTDVANQSRMRSRAVLEARIIWLTISNRSLLIRCCVMRNELCALRMNVWSRVFGLEKYFFVISPWSGDRRKKGPSIVISSKELAPIFVLNFGDSVIAVATTGWRTRFRNAYCGLAATGERGILRFGIAIDLPSYTVSNRHLSLDPQGLGTILQWR